MTSKTRSTSMLSPALTGNILYYILCALLFQLSPTSQNIYVLFFISSALLWFSVGMFYGKRAQKPSVAKHFGFALLAMLPIFLFLATYVTLTRMQPSVEGNPWILFYSFGAPLLFWLKPAAFLLNHMTVSFPIFAIAYIGFLMFITFISAVVFAPKHKKAVAPVCAPAPSVVEEERDPCLSMADTMQSISMEEEIELLENEVVEEAVVLSEEEKEAAENEHKDILRFIADTDEMNDTQSVIKQQYEESQYRIDAEADTYKTMPMPSIDELYAEVLRQKDVEAEDEATIYMKEIVTDLHFVAEYDCSDPDKTQTAGPVTPKHPVSPTESAAQETAPQTDENTKNPASTASGAAAKDAETVYAPSQEPEASEDTFFSKFLHKKKED